MEGNMKKIITISISLLCMTLIVLFVRFQINVNHRESINEEFANAFENSSKSLAIETESHFLKKVYKYKITEISTRNGKEYTFTFATYTVGFIIVGYEDMWGLFGNVSDADLLHYAK